MARQPNFIVFMTDQHRADHLGCYGNRVLRTPAIDALAARGTRFDNFYVASPVCMPNRASFMTGRLPSLHGVRHNGIPLSTEHVTFVELLAAAGYATALAGKAHLQNFTGAPPRVTHEPPPGKTPPPEALREADRRQRRGPAYEAENDRLWREGNHGVSLPFYGFGQANICTGHGDQVGGAYRRWLADRHPAPETLTGPANALPDPTRTAPQAWRTQVPEDLYPTAYVEDRAADFLRTHAAKDADKPFFLQVSYPDPHHPFTPPGRYWDLYNPKDVELPANFAAGNLPALHHLRAQLAAGTAVRDTPTLPFAVTEDEARVIVALTWGMIAMIDDAVGRLVQLIVDLGMADDTVLIFTADHGDYMADHGLMTKYLLHYRSLIRVPFIIADPQAPQGAVWNDLGSTLDIGPTILARAGLAPFNGMQGRDLFDGAAPESLLIEEDSPVPMYGEGAPQRVRTLVTERWRLSHHQGPDWWELYDLHADPDENVNLWGRAEARDAAEALMRDMIGRMTALQDTSPLPTGRA